MNEATLLRKVKEGLNITGDYQNNTIQLHIDEVKEYLLDSGVKPTVVASSASIGVIIRGVSDLWNGDTLSPYFKERAIQLALKE